MEVHENPARALSDGPNSYRLGGMKALLSRLLRIHAATTA
jgi:3-deoxy-D-manno-octulosonic acid (KDO) 8-phosphate synthase